MYKGDTTTLICLELHRRSSIGVRWIYWYVLDLIALWLAARLGNLRHPCCCWHKLYINRCTTPCQVCAGEVESPPHSTRRMNKSYRVPEKYVSSLSCWYYLVCMGFECVVLFKRHMQSGHGNVYIDSFGLFISTPLASLCALMLSKWRFNDFHLHKNEKAWLKTTERKNTSRKCLGSETKIN